MSKLFRTILSPIGFDSNSLSALGTAGELARLATATLWALHVLTPASSSPTPAQLDAGEAEEHSARERLLAICADRLPGVRSEVLVRTGDAAICILRTVEELKADLVVIATHASRTKPRPFPGSVAARIIQESLCPVLTVRPSATGDPDAVGTHMTPAPTTISADTTIGRVRELMSRDRVRWFPVVDGREVVGVLTDRDIASSEAEAETTVGTLMSRAVIAVSPRSSLQEAARQLFECEVDGLPVVDERKLVGVITRSDILKVFAEVEPVGQLGLKRVFTRKNPTVSG